jgi:hypothetical protein
MSLEEPIQHQNTLLGGPPVDSWASEFQHTMLQGPNHAPLSSHEMVQFEQIFHRGGPPVPTQEWASEFRQLHNGPIQGSPAVPLNQKELEMEKEFHDAFARAEKGIL